MSNLLKSDKNDIASLKIQVQKLQEDLIVMRSQKEEYQSKYQELLDKEQQVKNEAEVLKF